MAQAQALLIAYACVPGQSGPGQRAARRALALAGSTDMDILSARCHDRPHIEKLNGKARLLRVSMRGDTLGARLGAFQRAVRRQLAGGDYQLVVFSDPYSGVEVLDARASHPHKAVFDAAQPAWLELLSRMESGSEPRDEALLEEMRTREARCYAESDAVVLPTESAKLRLSLLGVTPRLVRVAPSAVELARFPLPARVRAPGAALRAVYLGSGSPWQGLDVLVPALARAVQLGANVRLSVAGVIGARLRQLVDDAVLANVADRVDVHGEISPDEVPPLLAASDVGLCPLPAIARNEAGVSPQKVVEYLASGLPVIMSDLTCAREHLGDGDAGLLVAAGDPESFARALVRLAHDEELRGRLSQRARRAAELRFTAEREAGELTALAAQLTSAGVAFDPGAFAPESTERTADDPLEPTSDSLTDPTFSPPWTAPRKSR